MTTYIETRVISLNSESADIYRNGSFLSDMVFGFSGLLKDEPDILHKQITLANAQIPVSFYIVNYTNNVFIFNDETTDFTISIPVGNYNSTTFITAIINSILFTAGFTITITISKITGIFTFTASNVFTIISSSVLTTADQLMGLNKTTDLVATLSSGSYNAVCPFACNLLGIKQLQVKSSILSMNNFSSNSKGQNTLLATIPCSVGAWAMISFLDTTGNNISFNNATLDEIDIEIVDAETGKPINFGNSNWTMTLIIHLTRSIQIPSMNRSLASISEPLNINGNGTTIGLNNPLAKSVRKTKDERNETQKELDLLTQ
jgi:hypothetical protein